MQTAVTKAMVAATVTVLRRNRGNEIWSFTKVTLETYQICPDRLWIPLPYKGLSLVNVKFLETELGKQL